MSHTITIRIQSDVYSRLEKHAEGFNCTPTNVIEKLLNEYEGIQPTSQDQATEHQSGCIDEEQIDAGIKSNRLYSNKEIQKRISAVAKTLPTNELNKFCQEEFSKKTFGINFSLFVKVPTNTNRDSKRVAVKSNDGVSRWTWKFEFEKEGYVYAICTQWFAKNDPLVQKWLQRFQ